MLAVASFWGNRLTVPITFGTHFIFGSIASTLAAVWLGWPVATLIAGCGALAMWPYWDHGGYAVIAVAEAIFVSLTYRRVWNNVIMATTLFWLLPGALIFAVAYGWGFRIPRRELAFLWSIHCSNGILNALIASGLMVIAAWAKNPHQKVPLQQAFFNTLFAVTYAPMLANLVIGSRQRVESIQRSMENTTRDQAKSIVHFLSLWHRDHMDTVVAIADLAKRRGGTYSAELEQDLQNIHRANPSLYDVFVADRDARTFGFHPSRGPRGERLIGIQFADRQYFKDVKFKKTPLVSDVILGRGGIDFPIICFVAPILNDRGVFEGFALGSYDVRILAAEIRSLVTDQAFKVSLTDSQGTIIASTDPEIQPLHSHQEYFAAHLVNTSSHSYFRHPAVRHSWPSYRFWQKSVFGSMDQEPHTQWTVRVESDLGKFIAEMEETYLEYFGQIVALTLGGVGLSIAIMRWVSQPITKLASLTDDITKKTDRYQEILPQSSRFAEISSLFQNFALMSQSLKLRFDQLNREIEERKSTEVRLQEATKAAQDASVAKSFFLANMSHEIRTPLAAIIGYAEYLSAHDGSALEVESSVEAILRNSSQLAQLVDDILDLARIEAGHMKIQREWVTLADIVASGIEVLGGRAQKKGLDLRVTGEGPFPTRIWVDPTRLSQILINIVGNAIKFTEKGHVSAVFALNRAAKDAKIGTLQIMVSDTGIGLSQETQQSIFQPFVQGDASHSRRFGGTGLGLALSRNIASRLGGEVTLLKSLAGCGSQFLIRVSVGLDPLEVWYPDLPSARRAAGTLQPSQSIGQKLAGLTILLVEDSPDNRLLISRMLERYGARVVSVASAEDGIRKVQEERWDVILMDMQMPIMDGYEATKQLRSQGYLGPIIALTAHAMADEKEKCLNAGCDDHVKKPVPWAYLVDRILKWSRSEKCGAARAEQAPPAGDASSMNGDP